MKIFLQQRENGFTLIEVVVSALLMGLILTASYVCLSSAWASQRLVEDRIDAAQSARAALSLIAADLRSACTLAPEYEFLGMHRMIDDVEADNLDFGTHNYSPRKSRESDFCETSYFLRRAEDEPNDFVLWRRRDATPDPDPLSGGKLEEVARGVRGLRFEYYDGFDWYDDWGDPQGKRRGKQTSLLDPSNISGLPEAVRVTIWFKAGRSAQADSEKEPETLMFQTMARINLAARANQRSTSSSSAPAPGEAAPQNPGGAQ